MTSKELITIPLDEYNDLLEIENMLQALYAAGVDNWEGYDLALDIAGETD